MPAAGGQPEASTGGVAVPAPDAVPRERPVQPHGSAQMTIWRVLAPLLRDSKSFGRASAPPTRPCVTVSEAVTEISRYMTCAERSRNFVARRTLQDMATKGLYEIEDDWLWVR